MNIVKVHRDGGTTQLANRRWRDAARRVSRFFDKLGKPIDSNIKPTVIALQALKFQTTASCEGHLSWGEPYPWIDVGVRPELPGTRRHTESGRKRIVAARENLKAQQRMLKLLDLFYSGRAVPHTNHLIVVPWGVYGAFQILPQRGGVQPLLNKKVRRKRLLEFQQEFKDFTQFLCSKL